MRIIVYARTRMILTKSQTRAKFFFLFLSIWGYLVEFIETAATKSTFVRLCILCLKNMDKWKNATNCVFHFQESQMLAQMDPDAFQIKF